MDEASFIAFRLAKLGYYGGDPKKVLSAPADVVFGILQYENFEQDLQRAQYEQERLHE